ncbi:uncharacterized protein LOC133206371 [Saccostrea echinata]|uniref:uncharacterized protein LOC133206371 n=1 Tax=Saccostrea echinata TaxID=191078 RepID=UPI002A7EB1EF|nr:uncharacterized protein LOC133206371 [Saccostrea echinata]
MEKLFLLITSGVFMYCCIICPLLCPPKTEADCNEKLNISRCPNNHSNYESPYRIKDKFEIIRVAKRIVKSDGVVILTFMNKAFKPFLANWMCHTKQMVRESQILLVMTETEEYGDFRSVYPKVNIVYLKSFQGISENQRYCTAGFMRIGIYRTTVVNWILQEGVPIFVFELDALWLQNPLPFITTNTEYDITIIPTYEKSFEAAIGFYYMTANKRMQQFWQELTRRLHDLSKTFSCLKNKERVRGRDNDQMVLYGLIQEHYENLIIFFLPTNKFLDGKWYRKPETHLLREALILNFNFVIGIDEKIIRARRFGHWFVANDNLTCLPDKYERFQMSLNEYLK